MKYKHRMKRDLMAEEINEPKNIQGKPQATESVKHVHLERKRPKLSKFDDENSKNAKVKNIIPKIQIAEKNLSSITTRASAILRLSFA